jgi:GntR family transcriptional regulator
MYPPGARLPTEGELCSEFDVSRVTVRKALDELGDKGYLVRKPGKGTFVVEKKIQRTLSGVIGFTEMCRMMGYKPGAKTVKIALEQPTEEQTKLLHLKDDEQMLVVDRIRTADDKPVLIESNQFSEQFAFLFDKDLTDTSMYQIIKTRPASSIQNHPRPLKSSLQITAKPDILGSRKDIHSSAFLAS